MMKSFQLTNVGISGFIIRALYWKGKILMYHIDGI